MLGYVLSWEKWWEFYYIFRKYSSINGLKTYKKRKSDKDFTTIKRAWYFHAKISFTLTNVKVK